MTAMLLAEAFCDIRSTAAWSLPRWEALVRQARRADVLATLGARVQAAGLLATVAPAARAHLDAALVLAAAQERDIRREMVEIERALGAVAVEPVLLKGAAYLAAGLPVARGRLFADVDILVSREKLASVEAALMLHGWATTHHNAYDQRYYRQWMHELPPLRHVVRQTILDVHHNILPLTARFRPEATRLLAAAIPIDGRRLRVLAPADMVLHSATHLLCNEEFSHGFRDLLDLDGLMRHFSAADAQFWTRVAQRSAELDLERMWYYAMRYATMILRTPVPVEVLESAAGRCPRPMQALMDALFCRALDADHPLAWDRFTRSARRMLYVRGHWLRMPAHLLAYHLTVKAFRREEDEVPV